MHQNSSDKQSFKVKYWVAKSRWIDGTQELIKGNQQLYYESVLIAIVKAQRIEKMKFTEKTFSKKIIKSHLIGRGSKARLSRKMEGNLQKIKESQNVVDEVFFKDP